MGVFNKLFSKNRTDKTEQTYIGEQSGELKKKNDDLNEQWNRLMGTFNKGQEKTDARQGSTYGSDTFQNIENGISQANASETYRRNTEIASAEARKALAELGMTPEDLRSRIKFSRQDYIKPENINTENMLSNILTYLGVGPELANNPIAKEKLLEEISGIKGFTSSSKRQEWLKQFVDSKSNIKEQIIPGLQKDGYNFNSNSIRFAGENEEEYIAIELKKDEKNGISIVDKRSAYKSSIREFYNLDNILTQREISEEGKREKIVEERDSKNPFIVHRKTVEFRGRDNTVEKSRVTMGLTARGVVDMETYLAGAKYQYGDESEQEFYDRLNEESKMEMQELKTDDGNSMFIKYVYENFPDLCEEKQK